MAKTLDELELRTLIDPNATPPRAAAPFTDNARYLTSLDGFNIKRPAVPAHSFRAERDRALAPGTPTGLVPLDLSHTLGLGYPATTPFILSRYARIRAGETLDTAFRGQHGALSRDPRIGHHPDRERRDAPLGGGGHLLPARGRDAAPCRGGGRGALGQHQRAPARSSRSSGRRRRARARSGPPSTRWPRSGGGSCPSTWILAARRWPASRSTWGTSPWSRAAPRRRPSRSL